MKQVVIGILVVAVMTVFILSILLKHDIKVNLSEKSWKRTLIIYKYDWNEHEERSSFRLTAPDGSRNVKKWTTEDTTSIPHYDTKGNVSYTYSYDSEYHISYEIMEWCFDRNVVTEGTNSEPVYADFIADTTHRIEYRLEKFNYKLMKKDEKYIKYSNKDLSEYKRLLKGHEYIAVVNFYNGVFEIK